jgi:uncharacterized protein (DUF433 family)
MGCTSFIAKRYSAISPCAGLLQKHHWMTAMTPATSVIHSDLDILGGTPVFVGTRVPVKTLLDYLEAGDSLDEFLDHFPSVGRDQAIAALAGWCSYCCACGT